MKTLKDVVDFLAFEDKVRASLNNLLDATDDAKAGSLTDAIWKILGGKSENADALNALAQVAGAILCQRLPNTTMEEHSRTVSIRAGAFGHLLSRVIRMNLAQEPDAPESEKALMREVIDTVEGRDPQAKHH